MKNSSLIYLLALGTLGYSCFRSLSKNIYKRQEENGKYLLQKTKLAGKAGVIGGAVLMAVGIRILISHLTGG